MILKRDNQVKIVDTCATNFACKVHRRAVVVESIDRAQESQAVSRPCQILKISSTYLNQTWMLKGV